MNTELVWVLTLLFIAIVLFTTNKVRMDVVALLVITAFVLSGTLTVNEAVAGFSDPNILLIAALFVIGEGLVRTGVAYQMGDWLVRVAGSGETRLLVFIWSVLRARRVYEFDRCGGHFYPCRAQCLRTYENLPFAADDAARLRRAYQRHDDSGGNTAEHGGE